MTESYFGNTAKIAAAIEAGLVTRGATVSRHDPSDAPTLDGVDQLIVGSATHAMGLPNRRTRQQAETQGGRHATTGVAEWLGSLPAHPKCQVAAFSTVTGGVFAGSASKAIAKLLRSRATSTIARADFRVAGVSGPLVDGEMDRARAWGESLV
ncbi:MAG: flavodoxin domain-containing protein [Propionibacteriaceae bacterium]|nr:flavodoxin domain-containing protein [Propionibacteriaceae bacterium]